MTLDLTLARAALRSVRTAALVNDRRSWWRVWHGMHLGREPQPPIPIRVRRLAPATTMIRPGTSDPMVVWDTFVKRYHAAPTRFVGPEARLIWDLGANIGLTMADLAVAHPAARVVGVELDPYNARLAVANTQAWHDRCELLEAAVWSVEGTVEYAMDAPGAYWGCRVTDGAGTAEPARGVTAITLDELLAREPEGTVVDYVKMDIEGAERDVLRGAATWAGQVACIQVEVHPPYAVEACARDLSALGFSVARGTRHPHALVGYRPSLVG